MVALAILASLLSVVTQPVIVLPLPIEKPFEPVGKPLEGLVITLDAGHGGHSHTDGYAGSARGVESKIVEQDLNMLVTAQLFQHLQTAGAKVYMTRRDDRRMTLNPEFRGTTDRSAELGERVKVAEVSHSHLFLSLHHNSAPRPTAHGVVILIWPRDRAGADQPLELAFADVLRDEVEMVVPHAERFNHYLSEHPLVTASDLPSAVVEFGFLSNAEFDGWVSQTGAHRTEAIGAYRAIEWFWRERRSELDRERARLFPVVRRTSKTPPKLSPAAQVARSLWTRRTTVKDETNAAWVLEQYRRTTLSDRTLFHLALKPQRSGGAWTLTGSTNHPLLATFAPNLLAQVTGRKVSGQLRVLPDASLGDHPYAVVAIPMALTWGEPKEGAAVQSQVLLGEPLFLLDRSADRAFLLAHSADGYLGWVRRDAVVLLTRSEFLEWSARPLVRVTTDTLVDDFRIPSGALLPVEHLGVDGIVRLTLPKGVRGTLAIPAVTLPESALKLPGQDNPGVRAAQAAAAFQGAPYLFGGRSRLGLDCSGLTGVAWAAAGITLPRDAQQQILVGRLVATAWNWEGLRAGDLLFFIDRTGRVIHAGVSLGGSRFLHASPPEVQVNSLDPTDPMYSATWREAFAFGKRPEQ